MLSRPLRAASRDLCCVQDKAGDEGLGRNIAISIVVIITTYVALFGRGRGHISCKGELRNQVIHMIVNPLRQDTLGSPRHGGYYSVEIEVRIKTEKVAEDARERASKEISASFLNKLASSCGPILQTGHNLGEEAEVASVIVLMRPRDALFTYHVQGLISHGPEVFEH